MKVKQANYQKGRSGEAEAKQFLCNLGYQPLLDNYTNELGEIDLIMAENDWLVFVEVKYKSDDTRGLPEEMVNKTKVAQVKRVAQLLLLTEIEFRKYQKYRIDAVCILAGKIKHYINIDT